MPAAGEGGGELAEALAAWDPPKRPGSPSPHTLQKSASPNLLVFLPRRWSRGGSAGQPHARLHREVAGGLWFMIKRGKAKQNKKNT